VTDPRRVDFKHGSKLFLRQQLKQALGCLATNDNRQGVSLAGGSGQANGFGAAQRQLAAAQEALARLCAK
jgi:hypothetical protein